MRFRLLRLLDSVAHFLYCPTSPGPVVARARWHHRIHLIPGFVLAWVCDRYDLALGVTPEELRAGDLSTATEQVWREFAYHHRDDIIDVDSAVAIEPRTLGAYDWADDPSLDSGEVMRRFEALEPAKVVGVHGYRCPHYELTYANAVPAGPPSAGCGCTMQPVYR